MKAIEIPKYELGTVFVELTRRCNIKCDHCLRGRAECKDMSLSVMTALVKKLKGRSISTVCIGGGETTVKPELLRMFLDRMERYGVTPVSYGVVTNGKVMPKEWMRSIGRMKRKTEMYLHVSVDQYHAKERSLDVYKFNERLSMLTRDKNNTYVQLEEKGRENLDRMSIIAMGRGAEIAQGESHTTIAPYEIICRNDDDPPLYEDMFYIDADGNVWPSCDLSYNFMRRRKRYCMGNVNDPEFDWWVAARNFNAKHAREFPIRFVEPGYEDMFTYSHGDSVHKIISRERIERMRAANLI